MSSSRIIPNTTTTKVPTFTIKVNGSAISRTYQVLSIQINNEVNKIPFARLTIIDGSAPRQDFFASNEELFVPGNEIEVLLGYHSKEEAVFKGIITTQKIKVRRGGSQLCIDCKSLAVKLTIGSKNKYFFDSTDSAVIEEIIDTYSLEHEVEPTTVQQVEMIQYETTDWNFIISRAEANGKLVFIENDKIIIRAPTIASDADLKVQFGSSIEEFDAEIDARFLYTGVKAFSWNQVDQALIEVEGVEPEIEEQGNLPLNELTSVIGLDFYNLYHSGAVNQDELQAWADAQVLKSRLSKVRGRVKFQGYAGLTVGGTIELIGVGNRMSGLAYVSGIRHELSGGNWYTDAQFGLQADFFSRKKQIHSLKAGGLVPAINGLQIGVVKQLEEDPEGEDRIKVQIPIINSEEEGTWARLGTIDAGNERGILFRPEVEDEVIIGFVNDDPRDPIILGQLHSSSKPAPLSGANDNHEKGIITRSNMRLIFNDDESSISMETPGGNKLKISDNDGAILMEDQNGNTITMDSNGISINSAGALNLKAGGDVKLEGVNIEQAAQAQFKAEGSAGLEVSSSAIAVLKGALVQIN